MFLCLGRQDAGTPCVDIIIVIIAVDFWVSSDVSVLRTPCVGIYIELYMFTYARTL